MRGAEVWRSELLPIAVATDKCSKSRARHTALRIMNLEKVEFTRVEEIADSLSLTRSRYFVYFLLE